MKSNKNEKDLKKEKENTSKLEAIKKPVKRLKKRLKIKESDEVKTNVEFNLLEVVIIILITGIVVSIASGLIVYNNYDKLTNNQKEKTSNKTDLKEFEENYNKILNNYVKDVDKSELLEAAIGGMYNYLGDKYSTYIGKQDTETLENQLDGKYTGIGVEISTGYDENEKPTIIITQVFKDSPADKAGLKEGDILLELNGTSLADKDGSYVANAIKKGTQTENKLKLLRNNDEVTVTIKRELVYIDSVHSNVLDKNVGYIQLETFSATTKDQITKCLDSFDKNVKSLIIDLRDNTGGYLSSADDVSDVFVEKGKNIYQIKDREGKITTYKANNDVYRKFDKIVVLINESSASASEILALALKESANATIVGTKSYGKGSVQETNILNSGAMVKYTIAYWLSPKGNSINEIGITPDIIEENVDNQLNKAIEAAK